MVRLLEDWNCEEGSRRSRGPQGELSIGELAWDEFLMAERAKNVEYSS